MEWPPSSPDLNPIENLYEGGKQYNSKVELWDAIQSITAAVSPDQIGKLTNSMDNRLVKLIEKNGLYINIFTNYCGMKKDVVSLKLFGRRHCRMFQ
ncbi:Hypothetical predicted protein [Octopus vulgaris]|uniref:Uncharacterized protein n=1 Tax=Octopus vulgaris TaxID=6645 RepID=A0AA36F5Q1_OCTVU|nr:Hypothetical predicted protein [Octopus vulgaris]